MTQVLAASSRECRDTVSSVATAMATVLRADVRTVEVDLTVEDHAAALLDALERPETAVGVLLRDAPSWRIASHSSKPIVVVPPGFVAVHGPAISRVLLPLDGSAEAAAAVGDTMRLFADAGIELVILHVFDEATTPLFWDQAAHARQGWEDEFRIRCSTPRDIRLELRHGVPGEHVVHVAVSEGADLIALGWSQHLDAGRARTVRATVAHADMPVMLVPLAFP
ncbi:universal stress protein [Qaidamihabitans albus]|uniref:universal stress protein n=1 Tax=Qaidamihabitans albus TaxID=2795733 RepID=UPI0018F1A3C7|nr:universal stress protein [Qaidamihabitans albus]